MALVSVPAIYDGVRIQLLERPPVEGSYRVVVTFLEPADNAGSRPPDPNALDASFGAWKDDRPIEATLRDIYEARRSHANPPEL